MAIKVTVNDRSERGEQVRSSGCVVGSGAASVVERKSRAEGGKPADDGLCARAKALLARERSFIYDAGFAELPDERAVELPENADIYEPIDDHDGRASMKGVPAYLRHLYRIPLLTVTGERMLFRRMNYLKYLANARRSELQAETPDRAAVERIERLLHDAEGVRNQIAESNLRLIVAIARRFSNNAGEFEEMVAEGNLVLLAAIEKFDFARGFRFSTYATHAVQRFFYRRWKVQQRRKSVVQSTVEGFLNEVASPSSDESLDSPVLKDFERLLQRMDDCLDERERIIVAERFGLSERGVARTLRQIAADLGISKERVRQLQIRALDKLHDLAIEIKFRFKAV